MANFTISIRRTKQYGEAVTAAWSEDSDGTYKLDGSFSHGDPMPNYLEGEYELSTTDREAIRAAISRCAETGEAETLTFGAADERLIYIDEKTNADWLKMNDEVIV